MSLRREEVEVWLAGAVAHGDLRHMVVFAGPGAVSELVRLGVLEEANGHFEGLHLCGFLIGSYGLRLPVIETLWHEDDLLVVSMGADYHTSELRSPF